MLYSRLDAVAGPRSLPAIWGFVITLNSFPRPESSKQGFFFSFFFPFFFPENVCVCLCACVCVCVDQFFCIGVYLCNSICVLVLLYVFA